MAEEIDKNQDNAQQRENRPINYQSCIRIKVTGKIQNPFPYVKANTAIKQKNEPAKKNPAHEL
jgi:hypothetical protein